MDKDKVAFEPTSPIGLKAAAPLASAVMQEDIYVYSRYYYDDALVVPSDSHCI
jgi:ketosteroid isomerase-like protein